MSVLRAILGRFARLLVRIARRLDPGVAATPYWVIPERMAALRQRYPGAPEHWLEMLARRTNLGDSAASPAHRPEYDTGHERSATAPQPPSAGASRAAARPAPRFPAAIRAVRATARPGPAHTAARPAPEAPCAAQRSARPVLTFGTARVRNPIANLLRGKAADERRDGTRFDERYPRSDRDPHGQPAQRNDSRREQPTIFPGPDPHAAHPVEWIGPRQPPAAPSREVRPGWPEFRYSAPPGPTWPGEPSRQARHNPRFAAPDNRWPELPAFLDELEGLGLRASDEAALLAEQIGGKWSA